MDRSEWSFSVSVPLGPEFLGVHLGRFTARQIWRMDLGHVIPAAHDVPHGAQASLPRETPGVAVGPTVKQVRGGP